MSKLDIPFNISILDLNNPRSLYGIKPVTSLDTMDGATGNFNENGLFSISIFGRVGEERRQSNYSYIDIKIEVFHPIVYDALVALKGLHGGIMAGTEYAIWDPGTKNFIKSNAIEGRTGFHFFVEFWDQINFEVTRSVDREEKIKLIEKYKDVALTSKIIVMPAALRDYEVGPDGRGSDDEVNEFYRTFLKVSNNISDASIRTNPEIINRSRFRLQTNFCALYNHIENLIQGKKKLLMAKWASRRIWNGTRNVISAMNTSTPYLGAPGQVNINNTIIGLYQLLKALMPVARYHIRNGFLSRLFVSPDLPVKLINKKTLQLEDVNLNTEHWDRWATNEGIEKIITAFGEQSIRHKFLEIENHYVALIYKGPDNTFKIFNDINTLPASRDIKDVYPITFTELLYLSAYRILNTYPLFVTRYPITGVGSIYPSFAYCKTTVNSEQRQELGDDWMPLGDDYVAREFPVYNDVFVNSLIPHSSKLARLAAD